VDFFLDYIWNNQNIILTFVETKIEMEGLELSGSTNQELKMVYSPILGVSYELVEVDYEEEKE